MGDTPKDTRTEPARERIARPPSAFQKGSDVAFKVIADTHASSFVATSRISPKRAMSETPSAPPPASAPEKKSQRLTGAAH